MADKIKDKESDKLNYQRIYKDASASPVEQKEEKARSRRKVSKGQRDLTGGSGKLPAGSKVKGEREKTFEDYKKRVAKSKEYFNSKNRSKMQMPKLGVDPDVFSKHGGAGPRGKFLKRT